MKILILAIGKMKGADADLCAEYKKRITGDVTIKEMTAPSPKAETDVLFKSIPAKSFVIILDERGKDYTSREFASAFAKWQERGVDLTFMIGGADGMSDELRKRADVTLAFGSATWPHRLARVMLLEQLYRAQQINAGHPYHRD